VIPLYLLDTCIVSEPLRPIPDPEVIKRIKESEGRIAIPAIVWQEMLYGVNRLQNGKRKEQIFRYLTGIIAPRIPVIPYDNNAAWVHGSLRADREAAGKTLPFADEQVAATALANNMILVTRNTGDFTGIPLLTVENWFGSVV
jgi:tRNA(fMet)-specific endonuclease VapC